jgi:hypothetical protein
MTIKTFNPNRTVGGSFQLVRDANGDYSIKEVGFSQLGSLPLPDLADSAVTTSAKKTKTATEETDTTIEDQTKKAFELPKPDDDRTQADRDADIFQRATDVSKNLSDFETVSDKQKEESQLGLGRDRINPFKDIDTGVEQFTGTGIRAPRAPDEIFRDESNLSGYGAQVDRFGLKVEPDPNLKVPSLNDLSESQRRKLARHTRITINGQTFTRGQINQATMARTADPDPDTQDPMLIDAQSQALGIQGTPRDVERRQQRQLGMTDEERRQQFQLGSLGIESDPSAVAPFPGRSRTIGGLKVEAPAPLAIDEGAVQLGEMNTTAAKKTFSESVKTALKTFKAPTMMLVETVANIGVSPAQQRLNSLNKSALASAGYKTRGELGSSVDPGRIAGNPADNVFAGMNAQSARGNIMTASRNRIDTIRNSAAKARSRGDIAKAERMEAKANKFEGQRSELLAEQEKKQAEINKATMNKGPPGQDDRNAGGKIVCTMMNESYGFGSFRNKIWMKFHKDLSPEYQRGYHRLFLPLVKIAKTNKIIKNILEHIAVHSTIDMRQSMRGKKHLLGRIYRKILLPICYWAGKK